MEAGYFVETGDVLANKLGISDADELAKAEYKITDDKIAVILATFAPQKFDLDLLLSLHRELFEDIYDFAGKLRSVNIAKPDSPVPFCYADFLPAEAERIFTELERDNYLVGLNHPAFVEKLAYYASELNALHPFREGNGRNHATFSVAHGKKRWLSYRFFSRLSPGNSTHRYRSLRWQSSLTSRPIRQIVIKI